MPAPRPRRRTVRTSRARGVTGSPYRLRRVRLQDAGLILRQRRDLLRAMDYATHAAIDRYLPGFGRWFRRELRAGRLWGYVAETPAREPIGGGLLWLQPRLPSPRFRQRVGPYIFSVYTEPAHRGRGVATALVAALVESAAARGYVRVELHSTEMGRRVYERLGFEPTTQMRKVLPGRSSPVRRARRPSRRSRP